MALKHCGTWTTLQAQDLADFSNGDTALIYYNSRNRLMQFSSAATNGEDNTNHPYYLRPHDYATAGVWVEQVGSVYDSTTDAAIDSPDVFSADQIRTGVVESLNWIDGTSGMKIDLNNEYMAFKDSTFGDAGIQLGWDSSEYKFNIKNGNVYFTFDGSHLTISVDANSGTGVGIIYKDGKRWLYDFNPTNNGTVTPDGYNLFLGVEAGNLTIGSTANFTYESSYNIGVGYQSGYSLTKGYKNIGIGYKTLYACTSGDSNIAIGRDALIATQSGYSNIAIGNSAMASAGSCWRNVALGVDAFYDLTSAIDGVAIGTSAGCNVTEGHYNVLMGYAAGDVLITGHSNVIIGRAADPAADDSVGEIVIGEGATGNGSNTVTLGNTSIGEFHCQVALTVDSDERIKRNISPALAGLAFINSLNPITFQMLNPADYPGDIKPANYKDRIVKEIEPRTKKAVDKLIKADPRPNDNDKRYIGLVAQDVEKAMKQHGVEWDSLVTTSNRGKKAITYENLIMPIIRSVQELSQKVDSLEARLS